MLEVLILLEHRRFIDVIVGRYVVIVRIVGQLPHVLEVIAADIHIEKDHVPVDVLLPQNMFQVLFRGNERLWQARF